MSVSGSLLDEALAAADSPAKAKAMLGRLDAHLAGLQAWTPYLPDAAEVAAGEREIRATRERWGEWWALYCRCPVSEDESGRCSRCGGLA